MTGRALSFLVVGVTVVALAPAPHLFLSFDKAAHVCAFALLAVLLQRANLGALRTAAALIAFAAAIEFTQAALPTGRTASWMDLAASLIGVALGLSIVRLDPRRAAYVGLAAGLVVQFAYAAARPPIVATLNAAAWTRAREAGAPQAPWPGAAARIAYRLELGGRVHFLADSAATPALALAPGLWPGSAPPGAGFSIFMGHRNRAFRALGDLALGTPLAITDVGGRTTHYAVTRRDVVRWNQSGLRVTEPPGVALVTCWPVEQNAESDLRLIVRATPIADGA